MYVFEQRQFTAFNSDVKGLLWPLWVRLLNVFLKWQPNHLEWYNMCLADPLRSTLYTESDQLYMYVFEQRQFTALNSDVKGLFDSYEFVFWMHFWNVLWKSSEEG